MLIWQNDIVKEFRYYFKEAITWSDITSGNFALRYREPGSIHDVTGMSAFTEKSDQMFYLAGLLNSNVANNIFKIVNPTMHLQIGNFQTFPVLSEQQDKVVIFSKKNINLSKMDWNSTETAWKFIKHFLLC